VKIYFGTVALHVVITNKMVFFRFYSSTETTKMSIGPALFISNVKVVYVFW